MMAKTWLQAAEATPQEVLRDRILNPNIPKNEAEWWAHNHIKNLEAALQPKEVPDYEAVVLADLRDKMGEAQLQETTLLINEMRTYRERLQAIIDWADFALANPAEFNASGVKNLDGPVFDAARAELAAHPTKAESREVCRACTGNDGNMPCAYPSEGVKDCLRDKRLATPPTAKASAGEMSKELIDEAWSRYSGVDAANNHDVKRGFYAGFRLGENYSNNGNATLTIILEQAQSRIARLKEEVEGYDNLLLRARRRIVGSKGMHKDDKLLDDIEIALDFKRKKANAKGQQLVEG